MADKLLVEVDLQNGEIDDALPALIYLTNELYESGLIEVSDTPAWKQKHGSDYELKWRFSEQSEPPSQEVSVDLDVLYQIQILLDQLSKKETGLNGDRLVFLKKKVKNYIASADFSLLSEAA